MNNRLRSGKKAISRITQPLADFMALEASGAILLLIAAVIALVLANSSLAEAYHEFWQTEIGFYIGEWDFSETLLHWIDDGLMALFFFVVGLEIKREIIVGELSTFKKASLPILAALGGMVFPALIYLAFNWGGSGQGGWGIPMATDIAFALGILALLGSRVPTALKVFLTALAIVDDIGAIVVIAIFYTSEIHYQWLIPAGLLLGLLVLFNFLGVDEPWPYFVVATLIWFSFLHSGIHATLAGVLVALTIPAKARVAPLDFVNLARSEVDKIEEAEVPGAHTLEDPAQQHCAMEIQQAARHTQAPLQRLEHALHPVSTFLVLPLFALANAGVTLLGYDVAELLFEPVTLGIFFGLLVGKPLGIGLMSWLTVRLGISVLPPGMKWPHVVGAGIIAGVGFTMSLFIANLAFRAELLEAEAKLAVLITSAVAGVAGYAYLRWATRDAAPQPEPEIVPETSG
jgi:NhaA family Na+:H+ antiporter